jgi:hypothetical protein
MHKKHKEAKNIDTNFLDADCADYTDFVLAGFVFRQTDGGQVLASSVLKASFCHRELPSSTRPSKWPYSEAGEIGVY